MDRRLTALEVVGMAIRSEEDASKFYGHISKMIANGVVRTKYENLAKEEVNHGKLLMELHKQMSGTEAKPPRIPGEPETAEGGAVPEEIAGSLEDLLKLAIQREEKAKNFYRKAAAETTDPSAERILQYLADVEHGHALMLKNELEAYLRDADWYVHEETPEMVHAGP
jgi:rubrerythrin